MAKDRFTAITIYRPDTGQIIACCSRRPGEEDVACGEGEAWLPGRIDAARCRIDPETGEVVTLMTFDPDLSVVNVVGGLPVGTIAMFGGIKVTVEDGSLEIVVTWAETVRVRLFHPLYFPSAVEIACVPE